MPITTLNEAELEEQFDRSSGPGGQNVNKVSTKVTLRHLPTNILVSVQDTRSQSQNRELARKRLIEALNNREIEAAQRVRHDREKLRRQTAKRPRAVKRRILENKKRRGDVKKFRRKVEL